MLLSPLDNLYNIWKQAWDQPNIVKITTDKYESAIYKGIKIILNKEDSVKIYNTKKGSLDYQEIGYNDYIYFLDNGFKSGVYHILKRTYKDQINTINIKIQGEVNQRNNKKHYNYLKLKRDNILNKYTQIIKLQKL
tara:strand:- start:50 stop:457 length:408 start_codon:yes stop_codon:yes gene_type:complete